MSFNPGFRMCFINKRFTHLTHHLSFYTGGGSLLPGHLSDLVRRGRPDGLLPDGQELRAANTDPGLRGGRGRNRRLGDEEAEEEEEEGPGGQREEGGERGILGGRGHVHHRHQLGRGGGEQQVRDGRM